MAMPESKTGAVHVIVPEVDAQKCVGAVATVQELKLGDISLGYWHVSMVATTHDRSGAEINLVWAGARADKLKGDK